MRYLVVLLLASLLTSAPSYAQSPASFAGGWQQSPRAGSRPKALREIKVIVEGSRLTISITGSGKVPHVDVVYEIGGPEVKYIGLDGDEFHMRAISQGADLVFEGYELEKGHTYPAHEVWTLKETDLGQLLVVRKETKERGDTETSGTEYHRVPR